jgi:hypothetical protein
MKSELFHNEAPYTNLVLAIKERSPLISPDKVPFRLSEDVEKRVVEGEAIRNFRSKATIIINKLI